MYLHSLCLQPIANTSFKSQHVSHKTNGVICAGVVLTELFPVVPGQPTTLWLSRFALAPSAVENSLSKWIFCLCSMFRFQRGFLLFTFTPHVQHNWAIKPVSNRPPQLSREHHFSILQLTFVFQTAECNMLHEHTFGPFTWAALCHGRWFRRRKYADITILLLPA